jgi:hypothetical protein
MTSAKQRCEKFPETDSGEEMSLIGCPSVSIGSIMQIPSSLKVFQPKFYMYFPTAVSAT